MVYGQPYDVRWMTKRSRPRHWYGWRERTLDQFLATANSNKGNAALLLQCYFGHTPRHSRIDRSIILFFFFPSIKRSFFLSFSFNLSLITIIPLSWINIDLYHALFPLLLFLFSRIRSFLLLYFFPSNFNCVYKIKERTNSLWLNHAQIIRVHDRTLVCTTWKKKK